MHCYNLIRAGKVGAIGLGLSVCLGANANTRAESKPQPSQAPSRHALATDRALAVDVATFQTVLDSAKAKANAPSPQITPWEQMTVRSGDSLSRVFKRAGLRAGEWSPLLKIGHKVASLKVLHPGDTIEIRKTPSNRLSELRYRLNPIDTLSVTRGNNAQKTNKADLRAAIVHLHSNTHRLTARGTVKASLSKSLAAAGVPPKIATGLANIYRYRAKLSRSMHPGDRFSVIYDSEFVHDEPVETGPIIAASITTGDRTLDAFRAVDAQGDSHYYDPKGHSYKPMLSRHPVDYTRISSRFSRNRMHPILHIRRPHWGVDMAAARGTPIHAAADGTVKFAGRKPGYGRMVELTHFDGYSTRYGHMYRVVKGLHDGEHVSRGDVIGYVGATGEATGPHLHFEIRKDGVPHNPLTMRLPNGQPLSGKRLAKFSKQIRPLIAKLDRKPAFPGTLIANKSDALPSDNCAAASVVNAALALAPANAPSHYPLTDLFCVVAANNT